MSAPHPHSSPAADAAAGAPPVVGLTGGIGSGKSTVAARFRARGAAVIDADQVARDVVTPGQPALAAIAEAFGAEMLLVDGTLDRRRLGALVFAAPAALARLNAITHPEILRAVGQRLAAFRADGHPWVVYEAALILENRLAPGLSALIAVVCDPETQLRRVLARDGLDPLQARQRLAAQTDNASRRAAADYVIDNDGGLDDLLRATDALADTLEARFGRLLPPA